MIIEAGSYSLEQCFVQFKLTAHGYSPLRYRSVWRSNSEMYMVSCRTVSKMEIVMSYSRISPRLAISLLILIFLLISFRQSCRIGYNVRDLLPKNIGVLRCNHRTACFSFSCCSSHATRIVWSSKSGIELFFDILHMLSLHNYMDDAISILYISTIKLFYTDNIVHQFIRHCKRQKIWQRRKRNLLCLTALTALPPCVPALPARQHGGD